MRKIYEKYLIERKVPNYKVGSIIEYETFGGGIRVVKVTGKEDDIKNGRPGFSGDELNPKTLKPTGVDAWGYDYQIKRLVK